MSRNMGNRTNTKNWTGYSSSAQGGGYAIQRVCIACGKKHGGKSSSKCSKIKQQMKLRGQI